MSLLATAQHIERQIIGLLRVIDSDQLSQEHKRNIGQIKRACNEIKLDVRDYEFAETLAVQRKWAKLARHNIKALEMRIIELDVVFAPSDVAALSAQLDMLSSGME